MCLLLLDFIFSGESLAKMISRCNIKKRYTEFPISINKSPGLSCIPWARFLQLIIKIFFHIFLHLSIKKKWTLSHHSQEIEQCIVLAEIYIIQTKTTFLLKIITSARKPIPPGGNNMHENIQASEHVIQA